MGLFVESQAGIERTAAGESFGERFDDQGTLASLAVGAKIDIKAIQIDIAAFGTMQVAGPNRIEIAWEDRFKVTIGRSWEVDESCVEVHQGRGVGITGASKSEHQPNACHRSAGEVFAVVVVPSIVGREDRKAVLVSRIDPNSPTTAGGILDG